jgi:hypothetical protein
MCYLFRSVVLPQKNWMWMTAIYSLILLGFIDLIDMMFILFPEIFQFLFGFKKKILHPIVKRISFSILPQKRFVSVKDDILDSYQRLGSSSHGREYQDCTNVLSQINGILLTYFLLLQNEKNKFWPFLTSKFRQITSDINLMHSKVAWFL